jgi:hypothetical protein
MLRLTPQFALRSAALSACAAALVSLSGCAGFSGTASPSSHTASVVNGALHGGQQAIEGAHVYLYAASTSGYGNAATSMLTVGGAGTTTDGNGNAYVTTDATGAFSYGGSYTCTSGTQVYLLALGGNPGLAAGTNNTAIALSAALGDCANLTSSTYTFIDEATTVGMAYALNSFMGDSTHLGTRASNVAGMKAAFATVNNLVNSTTGNALATTPMGNGTAPQQYINTLANIISACVNQATASTTPCTQLFSYATPTSSIVPTDTLGALINIAAFPAAQTANLYGLSTAVAPFQPSLSTQPNDFALGITYTASVPVTNPTNVVIDASGNIWMANCQSCTNPTLPDSLVEYGPDGSYLQSYTGSSTPGTQVLHGIKGIAIDASSNSIYTINQGITGGASPGIGDDQLVKMSLSTGAVQAGFPVDFDQATYGVDTFVGIALDNSGELWATSLNAGAVVEITPNGNLINGSPFFVGGTSGVATDNTGNIWFAGTGGSNIIEFDTNGDFINNYAPFGLNQPVGMAINGSNELWTVNGGNSSLSKVESFNGANGSGSPYTALSLNTASVTAIDGTNQVLIPNCRVGCGAGSTMPDNLLRLAQAGTADTGGSGANYGAQIPGFSGVSGAAIDAAGNVWVANSVSGTVTEVVGFASPTIQPLALASSTATLGQLP